MAGSKEAEGPLGKLFDMTNQDDLFGARNLGGGGEQYAEGGLRPGAGKGSCGSGRKCAVCSEATCSGRAIATSMGVEALQIPMFGLYGACSTSGEALALAAMSTAAGYGKYMLAVTSSHFGSAEKEFRFPLGYASQRPLSAHWTVTGSGAFLVAPNGTRVRDRPARGRRSKPEGWRHVRIAGVTVGKIVDYGLKDSQNMGACMAPAAMDTIVQNFRDMGSDGGGLRQDHHREIWGMWVSPSCLIWSEGKAMIFGKDIWTAVW